MMFNTASDLLKKRSARYLFSENGYDYYEYHYQFFKVNGEEIQEVDEYEKNIYNYYN